MPEYDRELALEILSQILRSTKIERLYNTIEKIIKDLSSI